MANIISIFSIPFELLTLIIIKIPLRELCQLRCVCKQFNTWLQDRYLLEQLFPFIGKSSVLMYIPCPSLRILTAYSCRTRDWYTWSQSAIEACFTTYKVYGQEKDMLLVGDIDVSLRGSKGTVGLQLVNLATKWRKKLPSLPLMETSYPMSYPVAVGIGLDLGTKSYEVLAVKEYQMYNTSGSMLRAYVFNCDLNSWKVIGPWQQRRLQLMVNTIVNDGALYCFIINRNREYRVVDRKLGRFNEKDLYWEEFSVPIAENNWSQHRLFVWQGRIMLVSAQGGSYHHQLRIDRGAVYVWQLEKEGHVWVKNSTMPGVILKYLCEFDQEVTVKLHRLNLVFETSVGYLFITSRFYHSGGYKYKHVVYDLATSVWWKVPKPSCYIRGRRLYVHGRRAFQPRLFMPKSELEDFST